MNTREKKQDSKRPDGCLRAERAKRTRRSTYSSSALFSSITPDQISILLLHRPSNKAEITRGTEEKLLLDLLERV